MDQVDLDNVHVKLGIPALRDHQRRAIESIIGGWNVLNIAPTGSGKSEGYFGSGLILGGVTLIVCPLLSLAADQQRRLESLGLPVAVWNCGVSDKRKDDILTYLNHGWIGFLITTPESLRGRDLSLALTGRVRLAVVDEAHCCLKDCGFRPLYARLGEMLDRIGPTCRYACTATLCPEDRIPLINALRLDDPMVITLPVSRSNLTIRVVERHPAELVAILNRHRGESGIVFCATVATASKVHNMLKVQGWKVALYCGPLNTKVKTAAQKAFMMGELPIAVVTDAFLLGIDKSDIRFIVHYDYPKSIEDWCQGFGRAGRDGLPATVYGCFRGSPEGKRSREFLIHAARPPLDHLRQVWRYLNSAPYRAERAEVIAVKVLGPNGKYSANAIMSALRRFGLADDQIDPEDRRRRIYSGHGDFEGVDWTPYHDEAQQDIDRFKALCDLVRLPDAEIPAAIDDYFSDETDEASVEITPDQPSPGLVMSPYGDWPASWDEV